VAVAAAISGRVPDSLGVRARVRERRFGDQVPEPKRSQRGAHVVGPLVGEADLEHAHDPGVSPS
jgi:hypothetical protein